MATTPKPPKTRSRSKPEASSVDAEIGFTGLPVIGGRVQDEFLVDLRGDSGRRIYREMAENDDAVGAVLLAIEMMLRSVTYRFDPADQSTAALEARDWMQATIFDDMAHSFEDFLTEALTMLVYGWAYFEVVLKLRAGPNAENPDLASKFDDRAIGVCKIALRGQQSLERWQYSPDGRLMGMWQRTPHTGQNAFVPIERSFLLRTKKIMDNPEGRSILRTAYRSWYYKKNIQNHEAIGFERDLTGIPVAYVPSILLSATEGKAAQARAGYEQIVRDVKLNEHGGILMPSDMWEDSDGKISGAQKFRLELLSSPGSKAVNADAVIRRYEAAIARTVLAQFIMLGTGNTGSFALSKSQADLFLRSLEAFKNVIVSGFNKGVVDKVWAVNAFDDSLKPYLVGGHVAPVDLAELGDYLVKASGAGFTLAGDPDSENFVREAAGLPEVAEDALDLRRQDLPE